MLVSLKGHRVNKIMSILFFIDWDVGQAREASKNMYSSRCESYVY